MKATATNPRDNKRYGVQYAYILDSIDVEDYDMTATTDSEKIAAFFQVYDMEYNDAYNRRTHPNECDRLANYLQGLPGCISVAFIDYEIGQTLELWGIRATPANVRNWFRCIASRLLKLRDIFAKANE